MDTCCNMHMLCVGDNHLLLKTVSFSFFFKFWSSNVLKEHLNCSYSYQNNTFLGRCTACFQSFFADKSCLLRPKIMLQKQWEETKKKKNRWSCRPSSSTMSFMAPVTIAAPHSHTTHSYQMCCYCKNILIIVNLDQELHDLRISRTASSLSCRGAEDYESDHTPYICWTFSIWQFDTLRYRHIQVNTSQPWCHQVGKRANFFYISNSTS